MMSSAEPLDERPAPPAQESARATKRLPAVGPVPALNPLEDERTWLGRMLGAFRVARRIGKGRMSTVYLGEHVSIGSHVAIKLLHPHLAVDPREVARFYAEARALSLAAHENIVTVFDTGAAGPNQHYLIMEHLQGRSLAQLAAGGPVPLQVVVPILTQVCDALAVGHQRGLVHRDLRPENVLLVRRGGSDTFVKLLDFGTAALGPDAPALLQPADGRIDLYAVGVMAYRLLTGRSAVDEGGRRCSPREVNPHLSLALSGVVERALAERPEERFSTAAELRAALVSALGAEFPDAVPRSPRSRPVVVPEGAAHPEEPTPHTPMPAPAEGRKPGGPRLSAVFSLGDGTQLGPLSGTELTRGGFFACCEGTLPPLLSRPRVSLVLPGGQELTCVVEVVRHVDAALARAWGMPAGFGVQFADVTPALKEAVDSVLRGRPTPAPRPAPARDDASAEPFLREVLTRDAADPYAFLGLSRDATIADVRQRAREEQRRLEALRARPLSPAQQERLQVCLDRVAWAMATLGQAEARAEHDARIGNFFGVARCLASGMRADDIEARRKRFLEAHRGADTRATVYALTARSYEAQGQWEKALAHYEQALAEDPFNLPLHRRYWSLRRDVHRADGLERQATP